MSRPRAMNITFFYILLITHTLLAQGNTVDRDSSQPDPNVSNGTCYTSPGHIAPPNFIPCGNIAFGNFACCEVSAICLGSSLCYADGITYLAGCTDPSYEDATCPIKTPYFDTPWIGVVYCNGTSDEWILCDDYAADSDTPVVMFGCYCPDDGSPRYLGTLSIGSSIYPEVALPASSGGVISLFEGYYPSTVPTDANRSASTSSNIGLLTTSARSTPSVTFSASAAVPTLGHNASTPGLTAGAKAAIGISTTVGGCLAVGLVSLMVICIRRRKHKLDAVTAPSRSEVAILNNKEKDPSNLKSKRQRSVQYLMSDSWTLECIAMAISILALICIAVMLGLYDRKTLSTWSHVISLNTALSTLGTIMKGFLMISICSCLGQLKWLWYSRKSQALHDFQLFDQASRGPWGSALLLIRLKLWHLASVGAFVTLLALASDTFVQQSVSYPLWKVPQPQQTASAPYAQAFRQYNIAAFSGGNTYVGEPMMTAMYDGVFSSNLTRSSSSLQTICTTGNCTFPPYASLGVCSQCADVSSKLQFTIAKIPNNATGPGETGAGGADGTWFTLPNGLSVLWTNLAFAFLNMSSPAELNSDALSTYSTTGTLSKISILAGNGSTSTPFAVDCALYFCVRSYTSSVLATYFQENVTSTYGPIEGGSMKEGPPDSPSVTFELPPTVFPEIKTQNRTFGWDSLALKALQSALQTSMVGTVGIMNSTEQYYTSDIAQGFYYQGIGDKYALVKTVNNIAEAFTNAIRTISQEHVPGTAYATETHILVQWPWLLLPLVMVLLATTFLGFTIQQSGKSGIPSWRSSALAVMEHGVNTTLMETVPEANKVDLPGAGHGKETVGELESWAKDMDVRLQRRGASACGFGLVNT